MATGADPSCKGVKGQSLLRATVTLNRETSYREDQEDERKDRGRRRQQREGRKEGDEMRQWAKPEVKEKERMMGEDPGDVKR